MSRRRVEKILLGGFLRSPVRSKRIISAKAADYTCVDSDSSKFFTIDGAVGPIVFTLPAVTLTGWWATFCSTVSQHLTVQSAEGGNIVGHDHQLEDLTLTSIAFTQANQRPGNSVTFTSTGTIWIPQMHLFGRNSAISTIVPAVTT